MIIILNFFLGFLSQIISYTFAGFGLAAGFALFKYFQNYFYLKFSLDVLRSEPCST